jgi:hypothetical protein
VRRYIFLIAVMALVWTVPIPVYSQTPTVTLPTPAAPSISGQWTYRSYVNTSDLVNGDAAKALALIFGEGTFTFQVTSTRVLSGTLDMGGGYVLDLKGKVEPATRNAPLRVEIAGFGRPSTPTAGWEYDYHGELAYQWPKGVGQVPALVGSVLRAKPHNGSPAGYVASFIAVSHP